MTSPLLLAISPMVEQPTPTPSLPMAKDKGKALAMTLEVRKSPRFQAGEKLMKDAIRIAPLDTCQSKRKL